MEGIRAFETGKKRGFPGSSLAEGDDQAAGHDQPAARVDGQGGGLTEAEFVQDLGHEEKQHYVDAQQLSEVPAGNVDY